MALLRTEEPIKAVDRAAGRLTVDVLGPLRVAVDGRPVAVTAGRLRALLGVLAMSAGRALPVDRLAAAVWDDEPPADPRRSLSTYVARLRAVLGAGAISTHVDGYALRVAPERVDALRFGQLLDAAATTADAETRRARLTEALALWRGEPFADLRTRWLLRTEAPRLIERRLGAIEQRIDLDLAAGAVHDVVGELRELVDRHPLRESLWVRLLVALRRCGRPAEALAAYERIRRCLADEMGVDPGRELQRVYAELLAGVSRPGDPLAPASVRPTRDRLVGSVDHLAGQPVMIIAITGAAGLGRTALAVRRAQRPADGARHPDSYGVHPDDAPTDPALRRFLDALDELLREP